VECKDYLGEHFTPLIRLALSGGTGTQYFYPVSSTSTAFCHLAIIGNWHVTCADQQEQEAPG